MLKLVLALLIAVVAALRLPGAASEGDRSAATRLRALSVATAVLGLAALALAQVLAHG